MGRRSRADRAVRGRRRVRRGARARDVPRSAPGRRAAAGGVRGRPIRRPAGRSRCLRAGARRTALLRPADRRRDRNSTVIGAPGTLSPPVSIDLAVTTPAFLDLTFVGLEALPGPGEERFAGDLLRSPGGGAITVVAAARLGLRSALVAPLGDDLAGEYVRREVEAEGVLVTGYTPSKTPQTVVMPVGDERTMVTVDPGIRARAADLADLHPAAVACNVAQLDLVPDGARAYLTCGDDDARAFAGRAPAGLAGIQGLFLGVPDAITLTGADDADAAAQQLAETIPTVVLTLGARGLLAIVGGRRVEVPDFDAARSSTRPATATWCARRTRGPTCAGRAGGRARLGVAVHAPGDDGADRHRRRASRSGGCSRRAPPAGSWRPPRELNRRRRRLRLAAALLAELLHSALPRGDDRRREGIRWMDSTTMRAVVLRAAGGPDQLVLEQGHDPGAARRRGARSCPCGGAHARRARVACRPAPGDPLLRAVRRRRRPRAWRRRGGRR